MLCSSNCATTRKPLSTQALRCATTYCKCKSSRTKLRAINDAGEQLLIVMDKNWIAVENAYRLLQLAQQSIRQSEENLRLYQDYYRTGTSAMSDVLDAQQSFQQAHDSYVAAYSDYQTKITEYKISTGIY